MYLRTLQLTPKNKYESIISSLPLLNPNRFCVFTFANTARFPAGQSERFHPVKRSFSPPAVPAGITHYTLQCKVVCQRGTLWKPDFAVTLAKYKSKPHTRLADMRFTFAPFQLRTDVID